MATMWQNSKGTQRNAEILPPQFLILNYLILSEWYTLSPKFWGTVYKTFTFFVFFFMNWWYIPEILFSQPIQTYFYSNVIRHIIHKWKFSIFRTTLAQNLSVYHGIGEMKIKTVKIVCEYLQVRTYPRSRLAMGQYQIWNGKDRKRLLTKWKV